MSRNIKTPGEDLEEELRDVNNKLNSIRSMVGFVILVALGTLLGTCRIQKSGVTNRNVDDIATEVVKKLKAEGLCK